MEVFMAIQLSPNFTLEELIHSDYALRHNIDNNTNEPSILAALAGLSANVLEPIKSRPRRGGDEAQSIGELV
jgi:hypothetical protein